jgi:hypothetical protein
VESWADDRGPAGPSLPGSSNGRPARALIAYHEAGHAAVGHCQGLTFSVIYLGDASGQVVFDEQWDREAVVRDATLLDRYGLMLLAGGHAEQRHAGGVFGARHDAETLERMLWEARQRGTVPTADLWRRAERLVAAQWPAIASLAEELLGRSVPVADPADLLLHYPSLGHTVAETSGVRARSVLRAAEAFA